MLDSRYLGQSVKMWAAAIGLIVVFALAINFLRRLAQKKIRTMAEAERTDEKKFRLFGLLATFVSEIQAITILLFSAYLATAVLDIPPRLERLFDRIILAMFVLQLGLWGNKLILFWLDMLASKEEAAAGERSALFDILGFAARILLWSVLTLLALHNFGVDITALLAGLGVGGVAVALALQNILGDLFASLTIALDKPFVIGDAILVDSEVGVVEKVGLKTTRLRGLGGEQVIFSNTDLLKGRIHNFKRQTERRVVLRFGAAYTVRAEELRRIPEMVREIVVRESLVRLDRIHLMGLGDFDLKFELVYIVLTSDYNTHMDIQQRILTQIYEAFEQNGLAFAHPTQNPDMMRLAARPVGPPRSPPNQ